MTKTFRRKRAVLRHFALILVLERTAKAQHLAGLGRLSPFAISAVPNPLAISLISDAEQLVLFGPAKRYVASAQSVSGEGSGLTPAGDRFDDPWRQKCQPDSSRYERSVDDGFCTIGKKVVGLIDEQHRARPRSLMKRLGHELVGASNKGIEQIRAALLKHLHAQLFSEVPCIGALTGSRRPGQEQAPARIACLIQLTAESSEVDIGNRERRVIDFADSTG